MCLHLGWVEKLSPRRLMSGGAATNYLPLDEAEGAAFVPGCLRFAPPQVRRTLMESLERHGVTLLEGTVERVGDGLLFLEGHRWTAEIILVCAGHRSLELLGVERPWLFPLRGVGVSFEAVREPWNAALAALECYRGHLMLTPEENGAWLLAGSNPGAGWESHTSERLVDPDLAETLQQLAGTLLPCLREANPARSWAILSSWTADGLPLVGPMPGSHRLWVSAGYGSRSWTFGPALGEQIGCALLGRSATLLEALPQLRPGRSFSVLAQRDSATGPGGRD